MLVLKHLFDWSFDECEREVRGSLVYRPFCRIDGERVPDAKTLIRLSHCLGPDVLKGLVERLVARRASVGSSGAGDCGWTPRSWRRISTTPPTARSSRMACAY